MSNWNPGWMDGGMKRNNRGNGGGGISFMMFIAFVIAMLFMKAAYSLQ